MMKDNIIYNRWNNEVMIKTSGDFIYIICRKENQMDKVVERLTTDTCYLEGYEKRDDDSDTKWILTFKVLNDYEIIPELN